MRDRRQGLMTDTGHARRWHDKLFGFTLGLLLVFLVNWLLGCATVSDQGRTPVDCSEPYFQDDFRCSVYLPEEEINYEAVESVDLETVEFE